MSKKKFTQGLESLFGESADKMFEQESLIMVDEAEKKEARKEEPNKHKKARRGGKSFTSDLDSLFAEAMYEEPQREASQKIAKPAATAHSADKETEVSAKKAKSVIDRPFSGLDVLIRRTVDELPEREKLAPMEKRVTFTYNKVKFEKLKRIARQEKSYIKDVLGEIINEYLADYEKQKTK